MDRYAGWFGRHRRIVAGIVILLTMLALLGASQVELDLNIRNLFRSDDRRMEVLEQLYAEFGSDDYDCLVVLEADDLFSPAAIGAQRNLAESMRAIEQVSAVFSIADVMVFDALQGPRSLLPARDAPPAALERARDEAIDHPLVTGRLLSKDGRTTLVLVRLAPETGYLDFLRRPDNPLRTGIDDAVAGTPVTATLTGLPVIRTELLTGIQREQFIFVPIGGTAGAVIALVLFRRLSAVIIVTCAAGLGTIWTVGLFGLVGEPINPVNNVIPTIVLVIGYTDAVHVLHVARREIAEGATRVDAAVRAIRIVGPACALTSLTTAIGFASLAAARLDVIERFGVAAAAGAVMSFLAVLTTVPLLLCTPLGRRLCAPCRAPRRDGSVSDRVVETILARPLIVSAAGVIATIALAVICTNLYADSRLREGLPMRTESAVGVDKIDEAFGGLLTLIALVEWDESLASDPPAVLDAVAAVERRLADEPMLGPPFSILDVLDAMPDVAPPGQDRLDLLSLVPGDVVSRVYRPELRRAVVLANIPDNGTHIQLPVLNTLIEDLARMAAASPGVSITLSGNPVAIGHSAAFMIEDLAKSLAIAAGIIALVMTIAFRSVVLGLLCVVPNVLPLVFAGACLVISGHPLTITGVITFCVSLGIAVDDTIHVVSRARRAVRDGASVRDAVALSLRRVGGALIMTTAVLLGGFAALLFSSMPLLVLFGALCVAAFIAALVGDLLILPALLVAFWRP